MHRITRIADHPRYVLADTLCTDTLTHVNIGEIVPIWDGALSAFLTHLAAAGASPGTIKLRATYLRRLATTHPDLATVTETDLETWLSQPWKPETRKSARASITTFFAWAARRGWVPADPATDLPVVTVPAAEPRPAPADVVRATLVKADTTGDLRDGLMVRLALLGGLRVHEIAKVHADDVEGDELRVNGKGGTSRLVPLSPALLIVLRNRKGYLFPGQVDGHLSAGWVGKRIKHLMPDGWTAHTLRHAAGTAFYEASDWDLLATQTFLGHSKPETTRRYVRVNRARIRSAAARAAASWSGVA